MLIRSSYPTLFQSSLSNEKVSITIRNQHQEIKKSADEVLGYKVDKNGYFTQEFNKAAGIPSDYKIHSSTMQSLVKVSTSSNILYPASYSSIDIAKTVGNAYKIVSQLLEKSPELSSKESFSKEDLANYFPQAYTVNNNNEVTKVFDNQHDVKNEHLFGVENGDYLASSFSLARNLDKTFNPDILHSNITNGEENIFVKTFDTTAQKYTNSDGLITKGGLLIAFLSNNTMLNANETLIAGETTIFGKAQGLDSSLSQAEVLNLSNFLSDNIFIIDNFNAKEYENLMSNSTIGIEEFKSQYLKLRQNSMQSFMKEGKSFEDFIKEIENSPQFKAMKYLLSLKNKTIQSSSAKNEDKTYSNSITETLNKSFKEYQQYYNELVKDIPILEGSLEERIQKGEVINHAEIASQIEREVEAEAGFIIFMPKDYGEIIKDYAKALRTSKSIEEFKEKYRAIQNKYLEHSKTIHAELQKALNDDLKSSNTEQSTDSKEESSNSFRPLQVKSQSKTYHTNTFQNLTLAQSQQRANLFSILFHQKSNSAFDVSKIIKEKRQIDINA